MLRRSSGTMLACGLLLVCSTLGARQGRVDEILANAREAIGGEAKLKAVQSLSMKASSRTVGTLLYRTRDYAFLDDTERRWKVEIEMVPPGKFVLARTTESGTSQHFSGINDDGLIAGTKSTGGYRPDGFLGNGLVERSLMRTRREFLRYLVAWLLVAPAAEPVSFADAGIDQTPDGPADVLEARGPYEFAIRLYFDARTHRLSVVTFAEPPASFPPTLSLLPPPIERRVEGPQREVIETPDGRAILTFEEKTHLLSNFSFEPRRVESRPSTAPPAPPEEPGETPVFRNLQPQSGAAVTRYRNAPARSLKSNQAVTAKYVRVTQMRLDDYRPVDGILLPHRVTIDSGSVDQWQVSSFKINSKIDSKRFAPR